MRSRDEIETLAMQLIGSEERPFYQYGRRQCLARDITVELLLDIRQLLQQSRQFPMMPIEDKEDGHPGSWSQWAEEIRDGE